MRERILNGEKLARIRHEKGLTQKQLADEAGIRIQTISHWEAGRIKNPSLESLKKVCNLLGAEADEMFQEKEKTAGKARLRFDGKMLRFFRESAGYSQRELAARLGLQGGEFIVSKFENGKRFPKKENIKKMAAVFGIDEAALYCKEDKDERDG